MGFKRIDKRCKLKFTPNFDALSQFLFTQQNITRCNYDAKSLAVTFVEQYFKNRSHGDQKIILNKVHMYYLKHREKFLDHLYNQCYSLVYNNCHLNSNKSKENSSNDGNEEGNNVQIEDNGMEPKKNLKVTADKLYENNVAEKKVYNNQNVCPLEPVDASSNGEICFNAININEDTSYYHQKTNQEGKIEFEKDETSYESQKTNATDLQDANCIEYNLDSPNNNVDIIFKDEEEKRDSTSPHTNLEDLTENKGHFQTCDTSDPKNINLLLETPNKVETAEHAECTPLTKLKNELVKDLQEPPKNFAINIPYNEWDSLVNKSDKKKYSMNRGWTNLLNKHFEEKNKFCSIVFTNHYMKVKNSRKKNSGHYFIGKAHCKHGQDLPVKNEELPPCETCLSVEESNLIDKEIDTDYDEIDNSKNNKREKIPDKNHHEEFVTNKKKCYSFLFVIEKKPLKNCDVIINVISRGKYGHTKGEAFKRPISGENRKQLAVVARGRPPSKFSNELFNKVDCEIIEEGNFNNAPSRDQIATIQKEDRKKNDLSADEWLDIVETRLLLLQDEMFQGRHLKGFIRRLSYYPFAVVFYSENQLHLGRKILQNTNCLNLFVDATGGIARTPPSLSCEKKLFYYAVMAKIKNSEDAAIPIAEFFTSDNSVAGIDFFLDQLAQDFRKVLNIRNRVATKIETDFSFAMMQSVCRAFNRKELIEYVNLTYDILINKIEMPDTLCVQHVCNSHTIKFVSNHIHKFACGNSDARNFAMVWFAHLQKCKTLGDAEQLVHYGAKVFNSPIVTDIVNDAIKIIGNLEQSNVNDLMLNTNIMHEIADDHKEKKNQRESSHFTHHFRQVVQNANLEIVDQTGNASNPYYIPKFMPYMEEQMFAYFPLWSGPMFAYLDDHKDLPEYRETSSCIESHMFKLKHVRQEKKCNERVARCIRNSAEEIKSIIKRSIFPNLKRTYKKRDQELDESSGNEICEENERKNIDTNENKKNKRRKFTDKSDSDSSISSLLPLETWKKKKSSKAGKNYHKKSLKNFFNHENRKADVFINNKSENNVSVKESQSLIKRDYVLSEKNDITSSACNKDSKESVQKFKKVKKCLTFDFQNEKKESEDKTLDLSVILEESLNSSALNKSPLIFNEKWKKEPIECAEYDSSIPTPKLNFLEPAEVGLKTTIAKYAAETPTCNKDIVPPNQLETCNIVHSVFEKKVLPEQTILQNKFKVPAEMTTEINISKIIHNALVNKENLSKLNPNIWLNDEIITAFFGAISEKLYKDGYKILIFTPHFIQLMYTNTFVPASFYMHNVFDYDIALLPIAYCNHWYLCLFNFKEKEAIWLDSFWHDSTRDPKKTAKHLLSKFLKHLNAVYVSVHNKNVDWLEWEFFFANDIPKQHNGVDCGVFACLFGYIICKSPQIFDFKEEDLLMARNYIANLLIHHKQEVNHLKIMAQITNPSVNNKIVLSAVVRKAVHVEPNFILTTGKPPRAITTLHYLNNLVPDFFTATFTRCSLLNKCLRPHQKMVYCNSCRDFFHLLCVNKKESYANRKNFLCDVCQSKKINNK